MLTVADLVTGGAVLEVDIVASPSEDVLAATTPAGTVDLWLGATAFELGVPGSLSVRLFVRSPGGVIVQLREGTGQAIGERRYIVTEGWTFGATNGSQLGSQLRLTGQLVRLQLPRGSARPRRRSAGTSAAAA